MKTNKIPKIPDNLSPTEKKLAEMFMECVPNGIIDSGRVYGYNYEYSRENPEWEQPYSWADFNIQSDGSLSVIRYTSLFHILAEQLYYDKDYDKQFQKWIDKLYKDGEDWEEHLEEFINPEDDTLCKNEGEPDWYGKWWQTDYTANNLDNLFDRQFAFWKYKNLVIIEIHNGCDIRWGLTNPVLFMADVNNDFHPWCGMTINCPKCHSYWDYDLNYLMESSDNGKNLDKDYPCQSGKRGKVGTLIVREDGKAYCPVCGDGILKGSDVLL